MRGIRMYGSGATFRPGSGLRDITTASKLRPLLMNGMDSRTRTRLSKETMAQRSRRGVGGFPDASEPHELSHFPLQGRMGRIKSHTYPACRLWSCGPVVLRSCGLAVLCSCGPVVLWSRGPVVLWSCGPVVLWSVVHAPPVHHVTAFVAPYIVESKSALHLCYMLQLTFPVWPPAICSIVIIIVIIILIASVPFTLRCLLGTSSIRPGMVLGTD